MLSMLTTGTSSAKDWKANSRVTTTFSKLYLRLVKIFSRAKLDNYNTRVPTNFCITEKTKESVDQIFLEPYLCHTAVRFSAPVHNNPSVWLKANLLVWNNFNNIFNTKTSQQTGTYTRKWNLLLSEQKKQKETNQHITAKNVIFLNMTLI